MSWQWNSEHFDDRLTAVLRCGLRTSCCTPVLCGANFSAEAGPGEDGSSHFMAFLGTGLDLQPETETHRHASRNSYARASCRAGHARHARNFRNMSRAISICETNAPQNASKRASGQCQKSVLCMAVDGMPKSVFERI